MNKFNINNGKGIDFIKKSFLFIILFSLFAFLIINSSEDLNMNVLTGFVTFGSQSPIITDIDMNFDEFTTVDDLYCRWSNSSDAINVSVVWYNGSVIFSSQNDSVSVITSPQILDSAYTKKDQSWTCRVTLYNLTDSVNAEDLVFIENKAPATPSIWYHDSKIYTNLSLYEDLSYGLTITSSDDDNDVLVYSDADDILNICSVNLNSGGTNCVMNHNDILNSSGDEVQKTINITFVADDQSTGINRYSSRTIDLILIPVNDAPHISSLSNDVIDTNEVYIKNITVTDEENNDFFVNLSVTTIDGVNNLSYIKVNQNGSSVSIYLNTTNGKPLITDYGNYSISLTVYDYNDFSLHTSNSYLLNILSVNHAPELSEISNPSGVQNQPLLFYFNATDIDYQTDSFEENLSFSTNYPSLYSPIWMGNNSNGTWFGMINISNLTNVHIINRNFTLIVSDIFSVVDNQYVNANLVNKNDYPNISVMSYYSENTLPLINFNVGNLTAYRGSEFRYRINVSDPDSLTYEEENLYYSINNTYNNLFNISSSGIIYFYTSNILNIGNYSLNVTVYDDGELGDFSTNKSDSIILNLSVLNNIEPQFDHDLSDLIWYEDNVSIYDVNASDADPGDSVYYYIENIVLFNELYGNSNISIPINETTGLINYTPTQNDVGDYNITLKLVDERNGQTFDNINLSIENINDPPIIYSVSLNSIIVTGRNYFDILSLSVDDDDLNLDDSYEVLNYSYNINPYIDVITMDSLTGLTTIDATNSGLNGSYNMTIIVTDYYNASVSYNFSFDIELPGFAPQINFIYPYGDSSNNNIIYDWINTSNYSTRITPISVYEGNSFVFNHSTIDLDDANLTYVWKINNYNMSDLTYDSNGVTANLIESDHTLNISFDYFSNSSYLIYLEINDSKYAFVNWTWDLDVFNYNRPPTFSNSLSNFSEGFASVEREYYFTYYYVNSVKTPRFYDPDGDFNLNGIIDSGESSGLIFNYTNDCSSIANITIANDSIAIYGLTLGNCTVIFTATDEEGYTVTSNSVYINISSPYIDPTPVPSTSSGGGSSSRPQPVPIIIDQDSPKPLQIISPKSVVIYQNMSMNIPIELVNNWTTALENIELSVSSGEEKVNYSLSKDYFELIPLDESEFLNLTLYNYREPGNYEITIHADVVSPEFSDTATIIVNSLESKNEGETLETKLSFAKDLLTRNKECQELNEILAQAEESLALGNQESASNYLDVAINGCKFRMEELSKEPIKDIPGNIRFSFSYDFFKSLFTNRLFLIILSSVVLIIIVILILVKKLSKHKNDDSYFKTDISDSNVNNENK